MKRIFVFFAVLMAVLSASAQKPSLNKAYNFYFDKDFVKANEAINLCLQDEKLSTKAQTWLYKGNICYFLANKEYSAKQEDEKYQIEHPDAPVEAYDAFKKSMEINANAEAMDMFTAKDAMKQLYPLLLVRGVDLLISNDLNGAKSVLEKSIESYEMDKPQYPMNGEIYYYYAYTLEMMGEKEQSVTFYNKAAEDGSTNPYVYVSMMEYYKTANKASQAKNILDQAKKAIPNNMSIRLAEIDYYYWTGDMVAAQGLLGRISANDVDNADDLVNLANFYIREKNYDKANTLLEKANKLSPNNFVVLYNLGVCTYNISENLFDQYNKLAISNPNSSEALDYKKQSDKQMTVSAQYFEKARLIEPKDLNLLITLRAIYARQQSPKYDEIDQIIKSIEKK